MSATELTEKELQDLITVRIPRILAEAMVGPEGEWYDGDTLDKALLEALEQASQEVEEFYVIHHQDGWSENNLPWLVCCNEEFNVDKHDSYSRFYGWNCPNETLEISENHPPKEIKFKTMKIDSF